MKVFLHLAAMLPHSIDKNGSSFPVEKEILATLKVLYFTFPLICIPSSQFLSNAKTHLIVMLSFQSGKSVDEFVDTKRTKSTTSVQPYLLAIKAIATNDILKYFLVLDSIKIDLGCVTFLRAVDWLFKSFHVFNVHYPVTWRIFFRFLQTCVYRVFVGNSDDVIPSGQNLLAKLLSL